MRAGIGAYQRPGGKYARADEADLGIPAERERVRQYRLRLVPMPRIVPEGPPEFIKDEGTEATIAQGVRDRQGPVESRVGVAGVAMLCHELAEERQGIHLGPSMPDPGCRARSRSQVVNGLAELVQIASGDPDHMDAADLGAAEAVPAAQRTTTPEVLDGAPHPAQAVVRIAETAQRPGLPFRIARSQRGSIGASMLLQTSTGIAGGEAQATAIVADPGKLRVGAVKARQRFGFVQCPHALAVAAQEADPGRDPDPCPALDHGVRRQIEDLAERRDRLLGPPDLTKIFGPKHGEVLPLVDATSMSQAAFRHMQGTLTPEERRFRLRRFGEGARCFGIFRALEVLGTQHGIALAVPFGGAPMQRQVDALALRRLPLHHPRGRY